MSSDTLHPLNTIELQEDASEVLEQLGTTTPTVSPSPSREPRQSPVKRSTATKRKTSNRSKAPTSQSAPTQGGKRQPKRIGSPASAPGELGSSHDDNDLELDSMRIESSSSRHTRTIKSQRDEENASDDENSVLVEMGQRDHRTDINLAESDEQFHDLSEPRRRGGCFCIQLLVDVLKVLSSSWLNFGLILVPFPLIIRLVGINQGVVFILAYLALFPLSTLLVCPPSFFSLV